MLFRLLDYLYSKPATGFMTSITGWFVGTVPLNSVASITYTQETLLWHLQMVSLLIGSIAGIFTIISLIRRSKKKINHHKKDEN